MRHQTETAPKKAALDVALGGLPERRNWGIDFWIFQASFWLLFGLILITLIRTFQPMSHDVAFVALRMGIGFTTTSILGVVLEYSHIGRQGPMIRIILIILTGVAIVSIDSIALSFALENLKIFQEIHGLFKQRSLVMTRAVVFGMWISMYCLLRVIQDYYAARRRAHLAESQSRSLELKYLQAQLNPHFLFNSLNAIVANKNSPETVELVTQNLSAFLRFSLMEMRPLEQLARELDVIQHYLIVQKSRFGENLQCNISCDVKARSVQVPPMTIQPLLENAINYGSMTCDGVLKVKLNATLESEFLKISVCNNGQWVPPDINRSPGSSHRNLRQRLRLLHGDRASLEVQTEDDEVCVTLMIPLTDRPLVKQEP